MKKIKIVQHFLLIIIMGKNNRTVNYSERLEIRVSDQEKQELLRHAQRLKISISQLFREVYSKRWKQISQRRSDLDFKVYNKMQSLKESIKGGRLSQEEIIKEIEEIQLLRLNIEDDRKDN